MVVLGNHSLCCLSVSSSFGPKRVYFNEKQNRLGPTALATQSVLAVSSTLSYQTPFSLGLATTVRVGNMLGSGQGQRAKLAAETSIGMSLFAALILRYAPIILFVALCFKASSTAGSSIFMTFRKDWGRLFNNDEEVVGMVATVLPLVALYQVCLPDALIASSG